MVRISVYIPSYNRRSFLAEAIESVLAQSLTPHQLIIVDDGSTDGSQDVIARYARHDPDRITPIYQQRNQGIAQTRNRALEAVTGEWVTYVDADDRFLPDKLRREADAARAHPDAAVVFSDHYLVDARGVRTQQWADENKPPSGYVFRETVLRQFPRERLFRCELVRRDVLRQAGGYDTGLSLYEDWELRIRLTKICTTVYVDEPLSEYRRHGAGLSSSAPLPDHLSAWEEIWQKTQGLLDDLPPAERHELEMRFAEILDRKRSRTAKIRGRVPNPDVSRVDAGNPKPGWRSWISRQAARFLTTRP